MPFGRVRIDVAAELVAVTLLMACGGSVNRGSGDDEALSASGGWAGEDGGGNAAGAGGGNATGAGGAQGGADAQGGSIADDATTNGQPLVDGGACSMPVGEVASGCPMVLAPSCAHPLGGRDYSSLSCAFPFTYTEPIFTSYYDIVVGDLFSNEGRLLRVADEAACSTTDNGWYFDNPVYPTQMIVCPAACECARATGKIFDVLEGCWTNAAPGVLDSEIPCPRCASSRPQSCGTVSSTFAPAIAMCEFPLEATGLDPATMNLVYRATAGGESPSDGYLTHVPSLSHCDEVDEGWTLDDSTVPPTVRVCPSACSCAKLDGATFMLEVGCPRLTAPGL